MFVALKSSDNVQKCRSGLYDILQRTYSTLTTNRLQNACKAKSKTVILEARS